MIGKTIQGWNNEILRGREKNGFKLTYNRVVSTIENGAVIDSAPARTQHAGVGAATVESDWQQVALTVVGCTLVYYLSNSQHSTFRVMV